LATKKPSGDNSPRFLFSKLALKGVGKRLAISRATMKSPKIGVILLPADNAGRTLETQALE
jgi:hypothetical protein